LRFPSEKGEISDASLLSNGNVIIAHQHGALVVSPDKKVIWQIRMPTTATEVHTIQALGLDQVMIFVNGDPAKVMTFDIKTKPDGEEPLTCRSATPKSTHGQVRHMRITPSGTLLMRAHGCAGSEANTRWMDEAQHDDQGRARLVSRSFEEREHAGQHEEDARGGNRQRTER